MMVTEEMPVVTEASMRIHLGKWRIESWGCAVHLLLKHKVINMKKAVLNKILKIVIAVASAILGAFMGHRTKRILRIERKEYQTY